MATTLLAVACGDSLGPGGEWIPAREIDGELRPEVEGRSVDGELRGDAIRAVSYNVKFGADPERLATAMAESDALSAADIVLIQEIESHASEGGSRAAALAGALGCNYAYVPARTEGAGTHGLALLSRFPIAAVEVMQLPAAETRIRPRDRIAMRAAVEIGEQTLQVVNVHLDVRLSIAERVEQMHPVTLSSARRVLIGGDFNTNPYSWAGPIPVLPDQSTADLDQAAAFDDYMRAFGFDNPTAGGGPTQDAVVSQLRLDSIYVRELAATDSGVERDIRLSDHQPIWVDLDWQW